MTRKHYRAIAEFIRNNTSEIDDDIHSHFMFVPRNSLVFELANLFAADNPNFDRQKFLDACGITQ